METARDVLHAKVGGGENLLCLWPRHGTLRVWGREMMVAYMESPCNYKHPQEVARDHTGIWKRGYLRVRRSLDGGATWQDDGKAFDNSLPFERQRHILRLEEYRGHSGPALEPLDMSGPDAVFLPGRSWCGDEIPGKRIRAPVAYCLRSTDRGRSWSSVPSVLWPARSTFLVDFGNSVMRTEAGRWLCWVAGQNDAESESPAAGCGPQLYGSTDNGATWLFLNEIWNDPAGRVICSCPHVITLPSGPWLCFMECRFAAGDPRSPWTAVCTSRDGGLNWSAPRTIAVWSHAPFPLRLRDGRIVVIFTRCAPDPTALLYLVSEDDGEHWSAPVVLRDDGVRAGPKGRIDGAYPVAEQMDDGRVFTAYGWEHDDEDVPWHGGRSFIAGTFFSADGSAGAAKGGN